MSDSGVVRGVPKVLLRLEGGVVLLLCLLLYSAGDAGWGMFVLLFLVPDLSMLGYLGGPRAGAVAYNAVHSYVAPLVALAVDQLRPAGALAPIALIWLAHIGFDRVLGYGLKYPDAFGHTHLGLVGRRAAADQARISRDA